MPTWRRLAIVAMVGFVMVVAVWAFRPWTSAVSLPPSKVDPTRDSPTVDTKPRQATFRCGPPFGSARADPSNRVAQPPVELPHTPCTTRGTRRMLAVLDVVLGSAAVVLLVTVRRPQAASDIA